MTTRGNALGVDARGRAVLTSSAGQQVMMEWERAYMERCVAALDIRRGADRVLEVGFGLAYSAAHVQRFGPRRHTIIECDEEVLQRADAFATAHPSVRVVRGTWQAALPALGEFDCVFFDDFPLPELQQPQWPRARSRWHEFLDVALQHAASGARISGYLARPLKLARPGCSVSVESFAVQVPDNCDYFPYEAALVPVITVVDPAAARSHVEAYESASAFAPARRSRRFVQAFERARETQDGVDFHYSDDEELAADVGERHGGSDASQATAPRYSDAESRCAFLRSLRQAKARRADRDACGDR